MFICRGGGYCSSAVDRLVARLGEGGHTARVSFEQNIEGILRPMVDDRNPA